MITKGIIKSIDLLGNTCTVHLPFFETAGNDPIIETATVSNTPGSYNGYKVGDVVYVAFEDGNMDTPVVIGKLYLGTEKEKADPRGVSNVEESTTTKKATLPADAKLTAEIDSSVPNTTVPYSSLSSIANGLNTLNTNVSQMDRDYGNKFKQVISNAGGLKSELEQTAKNMVAKVSGCELDAEGNPIRQAQFGWSLQEGSWTVFNQDKNILTADEDGLHVSGQVDADKGHIGKFIIGGDHECTNSEGKPTLASGIYSEGYIEKYEATPTAQGVYVGTDGIKLGKNFSVDTEGKLSTKSGKIGDFTITDTSLSAGGGTSAVVLGTDAILLGGTTTSTAPFSVTNTGELTATKGKIGNFNISKTGLRYSYKSSSGEDGLLSISADSKNTSIVISHDEANHGVFDDYVEIKADGIVIGSSDPFNSSTESSHWITVRTWTPGSASIIYEYDLYLVSDSASDDTGYVRFKRRTAGVGA